MVIFLGLVVAFYSTPLGREFGLVSILSGIDRGSLDSLAGAPFSGNLKVPVKLVITPMHGKTGYVKYHLQRSRTVRIVKGNLSPNTVFH